MTKSWGYALLPLLSACGDMGVLNEKVNILIQFLPHKPLNLQRALMLPVLNAANGTLQLSGGIRVYFMSLEGNGNNWTIQNQKDNIKALYSFYFENETVSKTVNIPVGRYEIYSIGYKGTMQHNKMSINNNPLDVKCFRSHQKIIDQETVLNINLATTVTSEPNIPSPFEQVADYPGCFQQTILPPSPLLFSAFASERLIQQTTTASTPHAWRHTKFKLCNKDDPFRYAALSQSGSPSPTRGMLPANTPLFTDEMAPTIATPMVSDLSNFCRAGENLSIYLSYPTLYYEKIPSSNDSGTFKHKKETEMGRCLPFRATSDFATDPVLLPPGRHDEKASHLIMPLRIDLYSGPDCGFTSGSIETSYLITSTLVEAEDDGSVYKGSALSAFLDGVYSEPTFEGNLPLNTTNSGRILIFQIGIDPTLTTPSAGTFGPDPTVVSGFGNPSTQNSGNAFTTTATSTPPVSSAGTSPSITTAVANPPTTGGNVYETTLRGTSNTVFLRKF